MTESAGDMKLLLIPKDALNLEMFKVNCPGKCFSHVHVVYLWGGEQKKLDFDVIRDALLKLFALSQNVINQNLVQTF